MEFPKFRRSYGMIVAMAGLGIAFSIVPETANAQEQVLSAGKTAAATANAPEAKAASSQVRTSSAEAAAVDQPDNGSAAQNAAASKTTLPQTLQATTNDADVPGLSVDKPDPADGSKVSSSKDGESVSANTERETDVEKNPDSTGKAQSSDKAAEKTHPVEDNPAKSAESDASLLAAAPNAANGTDEDAAKASKPAVVSDGWVNGTYYQKGKKANGWVVANFDGKGLERYWFNNGQLFRGGLFEADAKTKWWAYSKDNGRVVRGRYVAGDKIYLADNDGRLWSPGWHVTGELSNGNLERYYVESSTHSAVKGYSKSGYGHYTKADGTTSRGVTKVGNKVYLSDNDGRLLNPGWNVTGAFSGGELQRYRIESDQAATVGYSKSGYEHYTKDDGSVVRGAFRVGNKVYLADNDGRLWSNGWHVTGSLTNGNLQRYYVDSSTRSALVGYAKTGGWEHVTRPEGWVVRGSYAQGNRVYLANDEGKLWANGWHVTGVLTGGGLQRYYVDASTRSALLGYATSGGYEHYTLGSGYVLRGTYDNLNGRVFIADDDGRLLTAKTDQWVVTGKYSGGILQRYRISARDHAAMSGFFKVDGNSYYGLGNLGYVLRGKSTWGNHVMLADNDGKLADKAGWLVTGKYDGGTLQRYWLEKVPGIGDFVGAKTGLFTLGDGTIHYGFSGVGYVERNARVWHGDTYYNADNDGLLTVVNNWYARSVKSYVNWMLGIAADDSHGYDQNWRWGERGDYDCSSFVVTALNHAGVNTYGATYTGNMRSQLTRGRIRWYSDLSKIERGDILLNEGHHTAVYLGDGMVVNASQNEHNGAVGGRPGDQTGREIWVRPYVNFPWDGFLRLIDE